MRKLVALAILLGSFAPASTLAGGVRHSWDAWADWYEPDGAVFRWHSVYVHRTEDENGKGRTWVNIKSGRCRETDSGGFLCVPKIERKKILRPAQFRISDDLDTARLSVPMWGQAQRVRWVSNDSAPYPTGYERSCDGSSLVSEHGEGIGRNGLAKGSILGGRVYTRGTRDEAYLEHFVAANPC